MLKSDFIDVLYTISQACTGKEYTEDEEAIFEKQLVFLPLSIFEKIRDLIINNYSNTYSNPRVSEFRKYLILITEVNDDKIKTVKDIYIEYLNSKVGFKYEKKKDYECDYNDFNEYECIEKIQIEKMIVNKSNELYYHPVRYIDNPVKARYEDYRKEIIDKIVDGAIDYDTYNNNEYFNDKLLKEYNAEYKKIKA